MGADIPTQIIELPKLSRDELLELWQKRYRKAPPTSLRRELLIPLLAYRIQENAYGGLKPSTRSELLRIARSLERSKGFSASAIRSKMKSGTRLLLQWRGETYEVTATESGYDYRGQGYKSLSQIAR